MKLRISLLTILIGMLFASCGLSTGKVAEQKEEGISVLRYDKLLSEYVRSNSFSAMGIYSAYFCVHHALRIPIRPQSEDEMFYRS